MSTKDDIPMDKDISDLYRSIEDDGPSADLDAAILAQAETAVKPARKRPAWIAPVGLAATVLLGVNLAVNLKDYSSAPDVFSEVPQPVASPPVSPKAEAAVPSDLESGDFEKKIKSASAEVIDDASEAAPVSEASAAPGLADTQPSPAVDGSANTIEVEQLLRQVSQGRTRDTGINQQRIERFSAEAAEQERAQIDNLQKPSRTYTNETPEHVEGSSEFAIENAPEPVAAPPPPEQMVAARPKPVAAPRAVAAPAPVVSAGVDHQAEAASTAVRIPIARETRPDDLEEVIVTGALREGAEISPHARLTAKEQAKRNESRRSAYSGSSEAEAVQSDQASPRESEVSGMYLCDLEALEIDADRRELAVVDARSFEPPLNALTWPAYIREQADKHNYVEACAHLAAYQRLYPDIAMIELLPVAILKKK